LNKDYERLPQTAETFDLSVGAPHYGEAVGIKFDYFITFKHPLTFTYDSPLLEKVIDSQTIPDSRQRASGILSVLKAEQNVILAAK